MHPCVPPMALTLGPRLCGVPWGVAIVAPEFCRVRDGLEASAVSSTLLICAMPQLGPSCSEHFLWYILPQSAHARRPDRGTNVRRQPSMTPRSGIATGRRTNVRMHLMARRSKIVRWQRRHLARRTKPASVTNRWGMQWLYRTRLLPRPSAPQSRSPHTTGN